MKVNVAAALLLAAVATRSPVLAEDLGPRHIDWFNGPPSAYEVMHDRREREPAPMMTLAPGDCIRIVERANVVDPAEPANYMQLSIDGHEVRIDEHSPRYCVGPRTHVPAAVVAIAHAFEELRKLFTDMRYDYYTERRASARSRPATASFGIPALQSDRALLIAGTRALALRWTGGDAPFQLALRRQASDSPLAVQHGVAANETRFAATVLSAGEYLIELRDANGQSVVRRFRVVSASALPAPTPAIRAALNEPSLRESDRALLGAGRLVEPGHAWSLEVYQRMTNVSNPSEQTRALALEVAGP